MLLPARIILNDHSWKHDCTVRNLTSIGACVELSSTIQIPDAFDITFDSARTCRPFRTIWRANNRLGVLFK